MQALRMITGLLLMACLVPAATIPVQDMSPQSVSLEYRSTFGGQYIPDQVFINKNVASYQNLQMLFLNYSPVQYLAVSLGIGAGKVFSESFSSIDFDGRFGFSPAGGITLFSPGFINDLLRITGGVDAWYVHSQNADNTIYREFLSRPFLGVAVSGWSTVDISVGVSGNVVSGTIDNPSAGFTKQFSNPNKMCGFFSVLLHSYDEGVYFSLNTDVSPKFSNTWNKGPLEASIAAALGITISKPEHKKTVEIDSTLFPAYKTMQKKMDAMEEMLK